MFKKLAGELNRLVGLNRKYLDKVLGSQALGGPTESKRSRS
ncbi:hypothetical protein KUC_1284 [Vreelandella boliviensis LC1]|uniref:Uncharacterized protein n=1 Tax=Vreelandella boliviensis LC1 TaxID=1072583 RepID=A0A7U9C4M7_9GAMM|nr:hypothetical protein KUC_1284 [Halomonas boliviensis LC1]